MKRSIPFFWGVTFLVALSIALPVAAAPKKKPTSRTKLVLETYPAVEDEELAPETSPSEIRVSRSGGSPAAAPENLDSSARTRGLEERVNLLEKRYLERATREATAPAAVSATTSADYDSVPEGKAEMIIARLQLVEAILRESGRAYDYRTHTSTQLRRILADFRAEKSKTVKEISTTALAE